MLPESIEVEICDDGFAPDPEAVALDLERQARDASSVLCAGLITRFTQAIAVPPRRPLQPDPRGGEEGCSEHQSIQRDGGAAEAAAVEVADDQYLGEVLRQGEPSSIYKTHNPRRELSEGFATRLPTAQLSQVANDKVRRCLTGIACIALCVLILLHVCHIILQGATAPATSSTPATSATIATWHG